MYYVNYHYGSVSISARDPAQILYGDGDAADPALAEVQLTELALKVRGRDVLFITHGFNVSYAEGARSLGRLANALPLGANVEIVGVLWPGDFFIPAVNYPAAAVPAMQAGRALGALCNTALAGAASLSFVSHSLGARVVLEAVEQLTRKARLLCITAGAVNDDCLTGEYAKAPLNACAVYNLASVNDKVLQLAFPVGDLIGQIFVDDHGPVQEALGRHGPQPGAPFPTEPSQIPASQGYGHHNYLPSSKPVVPVAPPPGGPLADENRWERVRDFIADAFNKTPRPWPPPP